MSSATAKAGIKTAAWRISLWSGLAFAIGSAIAFLFLQSFLEQDIRNRTDSWLKGELGVLADVAKRTPGDRLQSKVVREVAELASREVPQYGDTAGGENRSVFFLQTDSNGSLLLETGAGQGTANLGAILKHPQVEEHPSDVNIPDFAVPFRVASMHLQNGQRVYLALSTGYELRVLKHLRIEFAIIWCSIIVLGTGIVFVSTRRMLHRVQIISEAASLIGRGNLSIRVPKQSTNDEIAQLASTFNHMLDRVESSVQQLHTMSDSLAHDLRSPMTSMRGRLELALMSNQPAVREDAIISTIEELDRLSSFFTTALDVAEASADALRLRKEPIDLEQLVRSLAELYEPSFTQAGLDLLFKSDPKVWIEADSGLLQRTITNLLENSLKHTRAGTTVYATLKQDAGGTTLELKDDGEGFPPNLLPNIFDRYVKGSMSEGHGLGLAFVAAVVRSHDGNVVANNRTDGGASVTIELPPAATIHAPQNDSIEQEV